MLYVTRADSGTILGLYATAQDAMDAAAGRVSAGRRVEIIPAEAAPGSDFPGNGGQVWIWTARGNASLAAFDNMNDADAQRGRLGGTVRAFEISGAELAAAYGGGDLRKSAPNTELLKAVALGSRQDFPSDGNDAATRAAAYAVGFVKQMRKAFANPKTMGARL